MKFQASRSFLWVSAMIGSLWLVGCSSISVSDPTNSDPEKRVAPFEQSTSLISHGQYEAAYNENQKILREARGAPDIALFNMGIVSANSANPKKNYPRALSSFRTLVKDYPQSPMIEPAKTWIQVLEEYQKMADEKRALTKERESLMHEMDKLRYTVEKSRQVDVEIEKRRRETLRK